jgi:large subunit ribosomal protein L9
MLMEVKMEVILLERIDRLGQMGDEVTVKAGFARNFLFPQKKALRANKENRVYYESQKAELQAVNLKRKGEAEAVAKKMEGLKLIIVRSAGEGGQLYGSVSARDIGDALKEQGVTIERTQVLLNAPVKTLGTFKTAVRLHPEVKVDVDFTIARSLEEGNLKIAEAAQLLERAEDAEKLLGEPDDAAPADEAVPADADQA